MKEILARIGVKGARYIEENIDPQYQALKHYFSHHPSPSLGEVVANALVSYQLSGTGEQYWWDFAKKGLKALGGLYNKRLLAIKRKRLERIQPYLSQIDLSFYPRMRDLQYFLEKIMGSKGKTIVFAVKMYGYGARILTGRFIPYPMEVEIPWDSRIQKLSHLLGYKKEDWQSLSQETNIPPLHLDSILWPLFTQKEKYEALGGPYKELLEVLHGLDDSLSAFSKT